MRRPLIVIGSLMVLTAGPVSAAPIVLDMVAAMSPTAQPAGDPAAAETPSDRPYLDGMRLAVADVNAKGGVRGRRLELRMLDDRGDRSIATQLMRSALASNPAAVLYVGPGPALAPLRYDAERAGSPIVLLEGDVYTSGGTFRQVFQTTIPWVWQAKVIARYVVTDRGAKDVVFGGEGPEAPAAAKAFADAMAYWGGSVASSFTYSAAQPIPLQRPARRRPTGSSGSGRTASRPACW